MHEDKDAVDLEAVRDKYRSERDKRLQTERSYLGARAELAHFASDPYAEPITRAPRHDSVDVVIVGGGIGGLLAGARLRQTGAFDTIRIIDSAGDVGGTWYWNRFPGLRCDVESYIYMPLLEEVGTVPSEKYATGAEIFAHCQALARRFELYRDALFQTSITGLQWDEQAAQWMVHTDRDDRIRASFVCLALGSLHRPKLPKIPGIDSFRGRAFHASRWDYRYTGGDSSGGLIGLRDKRVGIIGTGATGVQVIPHLAQWSQHLYVFQRTPSTVSVRGNRPTDMDWIAGCEPGWQQQRLENFHALTSGVAQDVDMVADGWTEITATLAAILPKAVSPSDAKAGARAMELADFRKMEEIRARVDSVVRDPTIAAALKPYYRLFCKRPCFHDEYLDTYNRPNVTLVDTHGRGVERLSERGAIVAGVEYPLDCLVFASGYENEWAIPYTERAGFEIVGRAGLRLSEKWVDGARTYYGLMVHGFPNFMIMSKLQSGLHVNVPYMLNEQSKCIAHILGAVRRAQQRVVEADEEAEQRWVDTILQLASRDLSFTESCTPGLFNNEGNPRRLAALNGSYGGGSMQFVRLLREWQADGRLAGLTLRT
jgi:cyclohexanone monooxygenase/pentalenolactone D synthase